MGGTSGFPRHYEKSAEHRYFTTENGRAQLCEIYAAVFGAVSTWSQQGVSADIPSDG